MNNYINNTTQEQKTYNELRVLYSNISLAKDGTEVLMGLWYLVHKTDKPTITEKQKIVTNMPVNIAGIYYESYSAVELSQEEFASKKILEGENYIKKAVQNVVNSFNTKYGVAFDNIYHMAIYKDDVDYPLHTQCNTLIKWQNSMWVKARANQSAVIDGTMTQEEFIASLPTVPVV